MASIWVIYLKYDSLSQNSLKYFSTTMKIFCGITGVCHITSGEKN